RNLTRFTEVLRLTLPLIMQSGAGAPSLDEGTDNIDCALIGKADMCRAQAHARFGPKVSRDANRAVSKRHRQVAFARHLQVCVAVQQALVPVSAHAQRIWLLGQTRRI